MQSLQRIAPLYNLYRLRKDLVGILTRSSISLMIFIILSSFTLMSLVMFALLSYEFRRRIQAVFLRFIPQSKQQLTQAIHFSRKFYRAASPEHLHSHWYVQQWWILITGCRFMREKKL